jgi:integrase
MIKPYQKDGKKFYEVFVKTVDPNGKQTARRKKGLTSERVARDVEFEFKQELKLVSSGERRWTWKEWHEEVLRKMKLNRKLSTITSYDLQIKKWIPRDWNERELTSFQQSDVYELIFEIIGNQLSPGGLKCYLKMIKRIFEMAVQDGALNKNPATGLSVQAPKTAQKVLTAQEAELLLKAAKATNHRFYPVWAFALMTGMRSGEMYAIKWSDIDLESNLIHVTKQWTSKTGICPTKTRENRMVPISPDLKILLSELKMQRQQESDFVLPHLKHWTKGEQARVMREFCKGLGITEIKFHDLRATFITNMLAQGVPLVTVMAIVGHRRMSTTDIYLRLAGLNVKGATEKLGYSLPKFQVAEVFQLASRKQ